MQRNVILTKATFYKALFYIIIIIIINFKENKVPGGPSVISHTYACT